jgi:hypothetical protein
LSVFSIRGQAAILAEATKLVCLDFALFKCSLQRANVVLVWYEAQAKDYVWRKSCLALAASCHVLSFQRRLVRLRRQPKLKFDDERWHDPCSWRWETTAVPLCGLTQS